MRKNFTKYVIKHYVLFTQLSLQYINIFSIFHELLSLRLCDQNTCYGGHVMSNTDFKDFVKSQKRGPRGSRWVDTLRLRTQSPMFCMYT
jgi:hypothetical protein